MAENVFNSNEFVANAPHAVHGMLNLVAELNHSDRTPAEIAGVYHGALAAGIEVGKTMSFAADLSGIEGVTPDLEREYTAHAVVMGIALRAADRREPDVKPPRSEMLQMEAEVTHGSDYHQYAPAPVFSLEF